MSTMTACAYHPERTALDTCVQCGKSICDECRTIVSGKSVCAPCVQAIRDRITAESQSSPAALPTLAPPAASENPTGLPPGAYVPPTLTDGKRPHPARMLGGVALGFLAGLLSTIAWLVFMYYSPINISIIAIGIGWVIGMATVKGAGQGGTPAAIASGIMSLLFIGSASLIADYGNKEFTILGLGWFGWLCVIFGTYQGVVVPLRAR